MEPRGLVRIEARHYRCLEYVSQELRPFQILVGPNASGKSTFLDVASFLGDLVATDLDTAVRGDARLGIPHRAPDPRHLSWMRTGGSFELAVELALPERLRAGTTHTRIRYEIQVDADEPRIALENLWLVARRRIPEQARVTAAPGDVVARPRARRRGWKKIISRDERGKAYFAAETSGWRAPFAVPPTKTALASLPEDRERFPAALWLRDTLQSGVRRLALSAEAMRRPAPPTRRPGYSEDGSNLPDVVDRLRRARPDRFALWLAHVQEALPDLQDVRVRVREEDRHRYLVAEYANGLSAPSWLLSDGTLRLLALTLLAYLPEARETVYLVEEPENGIHPRALEVVFQSLSSVYEAQILVATHSPLVLGMAERGDLLCFSRKSSGAAQVIPGSWHPVLERWRGSLDLSTLFAAGVL